MKQQEVIIIKLIIAVDTMPQDGYDGTIMKGIYKLTGLTFNYTDETNTTIDEVSDKSSDTKEKGLLSKFFGSRKK